MKFLGFGGFSCLPPRELTTGKFGELGGVGRWGSEIGGGKRAGTDTKELSVCLGRFVVQWVYVFRGLFGCRCS